MRTSNAMQLKALVNRRAREAGISAQMLLQAYLLERLLERISLSTWQDNLIVKGGLLISSMVGIASRTTMDLDTTVRGFYLTHDSIEKVFREIVVIDAEDDWKFEFARTEDIRLTDDYPGIRVHLLARYAPICAPLKVDVTTGDRITPGPITYGYPRLFDDGVIELTAYPFETVLAEKLETVITRGVTNTRLRDFYDIQVLWKMRGTTCNLETLREALVATCEKRGSRTRMADWQRILTEIASDGVMQGHWEAYARANPYASTITLQEACESASEALHTIG